MLCLFLLWWWEIIKCLGEEMNWDEWLGHGDAALKLLLISSHCKREDRLFLDQGFPWVTENAETKTMDKGKLLYFIFDFLWKKKICQQIVFYKMWIYLEKEIVLCLLIRLMGLLRENTSLESLTCWNICYILLLLFIQEFKELSEIFIRNYNKYTEFVRYNLKKKQI